MRIINTASGMTSLLLGRLGENERTQFVFDVADWLEEYPDATITMYFQRPHSSESYPVVISQPVNGKVTWTVADSELQETGYGKCELVAIKGETVVKGHIWKTNVLESLDGAGDAPDPWESWMTEFTRLKGDAEDAEEAAEDAAEAAAEAAEDAEAARDAAQAAAGNFQGMTAEVEALDADDEPTIEVEHSEGGLYNFKFGAVPGTTFTPAVSEQGVLSWTNDGGKTNPESVNIKGPKGDPGDPAPASAVVSAVEDWLEENVAQETGYVLDRSLQESNAAAPADIVGSYMLPISWGSEVAGYYGTNGNYNERNTFKTIYTNLIKCNEGDKFLYKGGSWINNAPCVLLYNNGTFVDSEYYNLTAGEQTVTIPNGVDSVRFQVSVANTATLPDHFVYKTSPRSLDYINYLISFLPFVDVLATADMTETTRLYRYHGSIYFYNGSEWTKFGTENGEGSIIGWSSEVAGYYGTNGNYTEKNTYKTVYTDLIDCSEGNKFLYKGGSWISSAPCVLFYNDGTITDSEYYDLSAGEQIITIPNGVNSVRFQVSVAYTETLPDYYVYKTNPKSIEYIYYLLNKNNNSITARCNAIEEKEEKDDEYNKGQIKEVTKAIDVNLTGYSYTTYTDGGYYNKNNELTWLSFSGVTCRITDKIPCYEGQQFLYIGSVAGGDAFKQVFYLHDDTIIPAAYTAANGYVILTVPSGANYVVFQSTHYTSSQSDHPFFAAQYNPFIYKRNVSPLKGIKWAVIGDSISMPSGSGFASYCDMFVTNDGMIMTNLAESGTGFSVGYGSATKYYDRIASIPQDIQFITVTGSFNDLNRGPDLGTIDDETEDTIAGCMNLFFTELLTQFPTVPMAVIMTHPWSYYHAGIEESDNYVDMLERMAYKYGIPFYSIYKKTNLRPWNESCNSAFFRNNGDGVHPNTYGFKQLYALLKPFFEEMCYQTVPLRILGKSNEIL